MKMFSVNKPNKFISVLLALALVMSLSLSLSNSSVAVGVPTITVSDASCDAGGEVTVNVAFSSNPGIAAALISISYDEGLTLVSAEDTGLLPDGIFSASLSSPFTLYWEDAIGANHTENGVAAVLHFITDPAKPGASYNVRVSYSEGNIVNSLLQDVSFETADGKVTTNCSHRVESYTSNNDATCTVDGTKTGTCAICGEKVTVPDPGSATGHIYGNLVIVHRPLPGSVGDGYCECELCGDRVYRELKFAIGDINWDNLVNGKDDNLITRYINGESEDIDIEKADITGDKVVNGKDGNLMKQIINGDYSPD